MPNSLGGALSRGRIVAEKIRHVKSLRREIEVLEKVWNNARTKKKKQSLNEEIMKLKLNINLILEVNDE